jgi:hypothetical protein
MEFLRGLKPKTTGRFQLTSDGFVPYVGHYGGVWKVFRESIDYGYEIKAFGTENARLYHIPRRLNPVKCLWVKRLTMIGDPDRSMMTTNHSERCHLSMRLFNRRFTRKTLGFSKTLRNHKLALALQVAYFNFCRPHSALKIPATNTNPTQEQTPAMAQGITNRIWRVEELLGAF